MIKGVNFQLSATNAAGAAFNSFNKGLRGIQNGIGAQGPLMKSWNAGLNSNRRAVQQLGFQMSDFAVQVAGGQSAMLAFTQQGGQILQFFGPFGAVMAALLAVFGSLYIAMTKTGTAIDQLYPYLGALESEFRGIVDAMGSVISMAGQMGVFLIQNLDQIIITAAVAAGYFATQWVASMVAAAASTWTLVGALAALKAALITTGLGAVIVLVGYLIERFITLANGVGGFGNALRLVGDLASAVFANMEHLANGLQFTLVGMAAAFNAAFNKALANILSNFMELSWAVADGLNAMFGTDMFKGAKIGHEIAAATFAAEDFGAAAVAAGANADAAFAKAGEGIGKAWGALTAGLAAGEGGALPALFGSGGGGVGGGGGGGGAGKDAVDKARKNADEIRIIFEQMETSISDSLLDSFKALTRGTKSFAEVAMDMLTMVADKLIDVLMTPTVNALGGTISGLIGNVAGSVLGGGPTASFVNSSLGKNADFMNLFKSFDGGGSTWSGPRAGGLDGRGGRLALLHSDETVLDHRRGQGSGGGTVNVHMTVNTPNAESFRKSRAQIEADLSRMARSGMRGN